MDGVAEENTIVILLVIGEIVLRRGGKLLWASGIKQLDNDGALFGWKTDHLGLSLILLALLWAWENFERNGRVDIWFILFLI